MTEPDWQTYSGGTMVRSALWLEQVVGEGNEFTKNQLRDAFPAVAQIDRRVRDLRKYGWEILTSSEDASLTLEEQRFNKRGVPVWDNAARRAADQQMTLPATDRQKVLSRDGYMCTVCGIVGGEPYVDDSNLTAVLTVARRQVRLAGGSEIVGLATECKRCHTGSRGCRTSVDEVVSLIDKLGVRDRQQLASWLAAGLRDISDLDRAWNAALRLPPEARSEIASRLAE
jgi:5-methylcytosine-specific restriction endonuclease McrA